MSQFQGGGEAHATVKLVDEHPHEVERHIVKKREGRIQGLLILLCIGSHAALCRYLLAHSSEGGYGPTVHLTSIICLAMQPCVG
eukprot:6490035-Amphidinium_carterae.1